MLLTIQKLIIHVICKYFMLSKYHPRQRFSHAVRAHSLLVYLMFIQPDCLRSLAWEKECIGIHKGEARRVAISWCLHFRIILEVLEAQGYHRTNNFRKAARSNFGTTYLRSTTSRWDCPARLLNFFLSTLWAKKNRIPMQNIKKGFSCSRSCDSKYK